MNNGTAAPGRTAPCRSSQHRGTAITLSLANGARTSALSAGCAPVPDDSGWFAARTARYTAHCAPCPLPPPPPTTRCYCYRPRANSGRRRAAAPLPGAFNLLCLLLPNTWRFICSAACVRDGPTWGVWRHWRAWTARLRGVTRPAGGFLHLWAAYAWRDAAYPPAIPSCLSGDATRSGAAHSRGGTRAAERMEGLLSNARG